jgi:hypothetical protein
LPRTGPASSTRELARKPAGSAAASHLAMGSSKWMKRQGSPDFWWQAGYGAFSVAQSQVPTLKRYIDRQEEHHRVHSYQDELRQLLHRYQLPCDERYAWD